MTERVLVVEDETILRKAYVSILKQEGFNVYEAGDGHEALKVLKKVKPNLIILDILMPKMDGLAFLQQARILQDYPDTKVLAFSNLSDQQKLDQTATLGATKHILKSSLSPKQLVDTVRELVCPKESSK